MWRGTDSVFAVAQATVLWLGVLAGLALGALAVARARRVPVPAPMLGFAVAAYAATLSIAALGADRVGLAVVGRAGRHTGLATALSALALAGLTAWAFRGRRPTALRAALLTAGALIAGYALLQAAGADPLSWRHVEAGPPVFATLGNATFLSGWTGAVLPVALWGMLDATWGPARRASAGAVGGLLLAAALASGSLQGLAGGAVGATVVLAAWWTAAPRPPAQRAAAGVAAAVALTALFARAGALLTQATRSLETRMVHWQTASAMAADHPLAGVGPDRFVAWFRAYEAPDAAAARGLERSLDSPHNIALELLTAGGWPLLLTWLALVVLVGVALIRGWRRATGERRTAVAAVGAGWLAYLVQAAVSIDVPALAALGAVLAGATLALGAPEWLRSRPLRRPHARAVAAGAAVLALTLAVASTVPLRADRAAGHGVGAADAEHRAAALARARALAPWEPRYAALEGALHTRAGDRDRALDAYLHANRADPRSVSILLTVGRLAVTEGDEVLADDAYAAAVGVAPRTPPVLAEAGAHALRRDRAEEARGLLERALAGEERAQWWEDLADARQAATDGAGAAAARDRAQALRDREE